jgi:hypothetical protein
MEAAMKLIRFFLQHNSDGEYRVSHEIEVRSVLMHILGRTFWTG